MYALHGLSATAGTAVVLASLTLAAPAGAGGACGDEYVIARGDTLSGIAARCGSSVVRLMRANPRIASPAQIAVGWRLRIPGAARVETEAGAGAMAVPSRTARRAAGTAAPAPVALTGRIVNGRRCAMIETADGEAYGIVSPDLAFVNGALVVVRGEVVDDPSCTGPRTLLVDELTAADPT